MRGEAAAATAGPEFVPGGFCGGVCGRDGKAGDDVGGGGKGKDTNCVQPEAKLGAVCSRQEKHEALTRSQDVCTSLSWAVGGVSPNHHDIDGKFLISQSTNGYGNGVDMCGGWHRGFMDWENFESDSDEEIVYTASMDMSSTACRLKSSPAVDVLMQMSEDPTAIPEERDLESCAGGLTESLAESTADPEDMKHENPQEDDFIDVAVSQAEDVCVTSVLPLVEDCVDSNTIKEMADCQSQSECSVDVECLEGEPEVGVVGEVHGAAKENTKAEKDGHGQEYQVEEDLGADIEEGFQLRMAPRIASISKTVIPPSWRREHTETLDSLTCPICLSKP